MIVKPGRTYALDLDDGSLTPCDESEARAEAVTFWACRRVDDFWCGVPDNAGIASCHLCGAAIAHMRVERPNAIKVCYPCAGIERVPVKVGTA
jgi:hypothetical protein